MSWFTRSIANTFNLNDDNPDTISSKPEQQDNDSPKQGVKEDLSEITKTLTTKIWGVASFLAPPSNHQSDPVTGIRRDFAEIGGRFRSGISKLSNNIDVSEITKLASNILKLSPDAEAVGVTDEVLGFVRDVTMHPDTWMDFPFLEDEDDSEEFELSDAQQEHALAVESLVPRLPALRIELCPGYMSEGSFWKIYFVLVHPKLEPHVAELLSTPEIVKARGSLTHELKARSSVSSGTQPETAPLETSALPLTTSGVPVATGETEKDSVPTEEIQIVDKSVIQEEPSRSITNAVEDKDEDDWLKEDGSENVNVGATAVHVENDEDVSFSDLEDDEDGRDVGKVSVDKSEMKESSDWLDVA
ncbi:uncharacterized protein LOC143598863 [Bidens hawaiensis]|uniref:uncharacterized protein LOC143598863 n=1 Tax=Bidens hawaiensis TaxID=980011 RepID=UPI004049337A